MKLEIRNLEVAYGRTQVLFGVNLVVDEGNLVCLMGRNGVGETTLLNALMGLLPVKSGEILLDGEDLTKLPPHGRARTGIGYVPQGHQVFPQLTAYENLQVIAERSR
jgi:urea transport system ATP-binding protein